MDLKTRIELEVRARLAEDTARFVTEELRRHLPCMTLGELHAFLSTELGRRAFHVPLADVLPILSPTVEEPAAAAIHGTEDAPEEGLTWKEATLRFQADLVRKTLVECDWNVTEVARRLGLARSAVYATIDRLGIDYRRAQPTFPPRDAGELESED